MTYKVKDILHETSDFFVLKVGNGVEVYRKGCTHSTRCAQIYLGSKSRERGIQECERRQRELLK